MCLFVKSLCVLCETFENLKVQIERVIFVITEKPRGCFCKYFWMGGNFKMSEG
jgi:hypothetical protein